MLRFDAEGFRGAAAATLAFGVAYEEMVLAWLDVATPLAERPSPRPRRRRAPD